MNKVSSMPKSRFGGVFKLFMIFVLQIGFIVALHLIGSLENMTINFSHFSQWINTTPPEIALVASIRMVALVFSYWLVGTSFLYMAARAFNIRIVIHALELTTIPGVRRAIDAGLAAAIIGGTVFGGAGVVFAKTTHLAQAQGSMATISQSVKDSRVLYNPQPAGDVPMLATSASQSSDTNTVAIEYTAQSSTRQESPYVKTVVDPTTPESTPTTPQKDSAGNFIPTPAGGNGAQSQDVSQSNKESSGKSVIDPTPAEPSTSSTTTTPKVVVEPTSPPVVSTPSVAPSVQVGGQQVQRPNETAPVQNQAPASDSYTVVSGDNFWNIAKAHLRGSLGHEPSNSEVASYWVKLIDANRSNIRSGDPDLIFPGEVFTLPAI